jgi:hypothetical protein
MKSCIRRTQGQKVVIGYSIGGRRIAHYKAILDCMKFKLHESFVSLKFLT